MNTLTAQSIWKSFGTRHVLKDLSLSIAPGTVTALVGRNASGKTTVLNVISGLEPPDRGTIMLDGQPINHLPAYERARLGISRTFQKGGMPQSLTPAEVLYLSFLSFRVFATVPKLAELNSFWRRLHSWQELLQLCSEHPPTIDNPVVGEQLTLLGFNRETTLRSVSQLSLGQQQRLSIAASFIRGGKVWLLDEPTANIDRISRSTLAAMLQHAARTSNVAILLVEHNLEFVEFAADLVCWLEDGSVAAFGSPLEVIGSKAFKRQYLGER